nr:hypothetical protein [Tanacetum cinerariifolium]
MMTEIQSNVRILTLKRRTQLNALLLQMACVQQSKSNRIELTRHKKESKPHLPSRFKKRALKIQNISMHINIDCKFWGKILFNTLYMDCFVGYLISI